MNPALSRRFTFRPLIAVCAVLLIAACAPAAARVADPLANLRQADGTAVWQQEYRFEPPPAPWQLIDLDEDDYSIAFMKICSDGYPCQSTLAYAEEPFGYSRDFEERQAEFFRRFLWASRVAFEPPKLRKVKVLGQDGLEAITVGVEPVLRHKVWCKILFARRGERVVAFYFTQWRPEKNGFEPADEADFGRFVASFSFLQPSFYERLFSQSTPKAGTP
jgi:hypothetical protein